jgi:hypothetical protein
VPLVPLGVERRRGKGNADREYRGNRHVWGGGNMDVFGVYCMTLGDMEDCGDVVQSQLSPCCQHRLGNSQTRDVRRTAIPLYP